MGLALMAFAYIFAAIALLYSLHSSSVKSEQIEAEASESLCFITASTQGKPSALIERC